MMTIMMGPVSALLLFLRRTNDVADIGFHPKIDGSTGGCGAALLKCPVRCA